MNVVLTVLVTLAVVAAVVVLILVLCNGKDVVVGRPPYR